MSVSCDARRRRRFLTLCGVFLCLILPSLANRANTLPEDAPILISQPDSTRALAVNATGRRINSEIVVFQPGSRTRITLFVTNLELLAGEGATAFRADVEDADKTRYPLEIVSFKQTAERPWVYALTIRLRDDLGAVGDVLARVTWRGMSSNRVRLAIGYQGGKIDDDEGAVPTPMPEKPIIRTTTENFGGLAWSGDRVRFMEQATFGPNQVLETRLRRVNFSTWLNEQMEEKRDANGNLRYSTFPYPNFPLMPQTPSTLCNGTSGANDPADTDTLCFRNHYTMFPLQTWFFRETLYGEDQQLRRRVSWALHQIFVVGGRETIQSGRMLPYIQTLDRNAFGNYRNLLRDITLNPAMGNYLDMAISTKQSPNENYAREILQLFSIGVDMLNQDGTPKLDTQGNRIPTYDQNIVNDFTKVFTGWTFCGQGCPNSQPGIVNYRDPMVVNAANHDTTQKTVLNYPGAVFVIPEGQTPQQDFEQALDNIFYHPNVAPFVSKLLIQQLVTSNPTPAFVGRVSAVFNNNGAGVRGDMKSVVRAILLDPEARGNVKTDPDYGKLREPVLFATNILRPFNPQAQANAGAGCNGQSDGVLNPATMPLDQDVWNPPTVFNYYPMDYLIPNVNLSGPEFAIFSTGTALKRPNFVNQMLPPGSGSTVATGIAVSAQSLINQNGSQILNQNYAPCGTRIDLARLQSIAASDASGALLVDTLNREMLRSSMSGAMRSDILQAIQAVSSTDALKRARTAVYLVATSPQFQVQR